MTQQTLASNPFRLMIEPDVVIAAVERSERLGRLNRHLCRPLDRQAPILAPESSDASVDGLDDDSDPN